MMNLMDNIDLFDLQTTEARPAVDSSVDLPFEMARITLRDITACLRAVGAVALGVAAISRELREWERLRRGRRMGRRNDESHPVFHTDHV